MQDTDGSDPGAVANGVNEKDLTLMISQYMYQRFQQEGVPVTLIRSTDESISPSERVQRILNAYGNNPNIIVISNHINSNESGTAEGAEVIYALRNKETLARNILNALGEAGQIKRSFYQRRLPSDTTKDYYFIHRDTGVTEPVIVEYGFINNKNDLMRIQNNYKQYVDAVVSAVIETAGGEFATPDNRYVVKKGDTLWSIARMFNTTVEAIRRQNNLTDVDHLVVGQLLTIPTSMPNEPNLPGTTTLYPVQRGDTLWLIAKKYNTTVDTIKKINGLISDQLMLGQILMVPMIGSNESSTTTKYIVQRGDSLWLIASRYHTTIEAIKNVNGLTSDSLFVGQQLLIPTNQTTPGNTNITYTVQVGDTLWSIARKYSTSVNAIMELNGLTSNVIRVGQILKIY